MSGTRYAVLAYVLASGLLWGYAAMLWRASRASGKLRNGEGS